MTYNVLSGTLSLYTTTTTSAINCLERLISEITYYVCCGTLNHIHLLSHGPQVCSYCLRDVVLYAIFWQIWYKPYLVF